MLNLYEYHAKQLLEQAGITIPQGRTVRQLEEAVAAYRLLGPEVTLTSPILAEGRGKAGNTMSAYSEQEIVEAFRQLVDPTDGMTVDKVLVEQKLHIAAEYYLGFTIDPGEHVPVLIISNKGGMEIEELLKKYPESLGQLKIDPRYPLPDFAIRELCVNLNVPGELSKKFVPLTHQLYQVFTGLQAIVLEINPLVLTVQNTLIAVGARLTIDDNAFYKNAWLRQVIMQLWGETFEQKLKKHGIDYVEMHGNIGIICVGAGENMATMDLISKQGGRPACFLDISGGVNPETILLALKTVSSRPEVKSILANIFGGITRIDKVAEGLVSAIRLMGGLKQPLTIRLEGTNAAKGREIIKDFGLQPCISLQEAVAKAVGVGGIV